MSSSSGPVNWEMARRYRHRERARRAATTPRRRPRTTGCSRRSCGSPSCTWRAFTGLEAPTDVVEIKPVRRADWVNANTQGLRELLEPAAQRIADRDERARPAKRLARRSPGRCRR